MLWRMLLPLSVSEIMRCLWSVQLLFKPLEQRGDRVALEHEPGRDYVYGHPVLFHEYLHHKILRIGDAQRHKVGLVCLLDEPVEGIQLEAYLVV